MDPQAEKLALFRYGLIAPLVLAPLARAVSVDTLPRRSCAGSAPSSLCARFRPAAICAASSSIASTGWCGAIRLFCCPAASMKLRPIWSATPSRCASIPPGLWREERDAYLAHQLKASGVTQPLS